MKSNKVVIWITVGIFSALNVSAIAADMQNMNHSEEKTIGSQVEQSMSEGEVKKVDKEQGKLTIKHGELKNLGMPAMTMAFRVKDVAMLDKLKVGQKIKFIAENVNGALTVVKVE